MPWMTCRHAGGSNEHLDDIVRNSADCMDWWFHRLSCGRWPHSPVVGSGRDLFDHAFCDGSPDSLRMEDSRPPYHRRLEVSPLTRLRSRAADRCNHRLSWW